MLLKNIEDIVVTGQGNNIKSNFLRALGWENYQTEIQGTTDKLDIVSLTIAENPRLVHRFN